MLRPKYYPESLLDELLMPSAIGSATTRRTTATCRGRPTRQPRSSRLKATQDILDRHICDGVFLFRAPYGEWNGTVVSRLGTGMGFERIVGPVNWESRRQRLGLLADGDVARGLRQPLPGHPQWPGQPNGIFLMHDRPEFNVGYARHRC